MNKSDEPAKDIPSSAATPQSDAVTGPPLDVDATLDPDSSAGSPVPGETKRFSEIGPYRLIRKLGEGGMGQVWLAEQTVPLQRQVALKLIRAGMYDDSLLQRFQAERQSLAIMSHPAIAKVFDAGATSEGQPYFVMEYVPGLPISDYCDAKKLKISERLELFVKVCEGVQHAHQKAIIHRDLKPANILVIDVDGAPTPRIIDFGIAKNVLGQPVGETIFTREAGFVGTPGYMSPEQADPSVTDVDTRTDVYSLGVILYVLLTGSLPFDPKQWKDKPFHEVLRRLQEEDPVRPSTKVSTAEDTQTATAASRSTEPRQLATSLRGDLDWITMKAIEKDRARRYGTPAELALDIQHYLRNEPVIARPASTGYRLRKYVARHRAAVGVAAGLVILAGVFSVNQAVQLRRITRERDRADRVTQFMTGIFKVSDPSEARGNTITAREILDKASKSISSGLADDPELRAELTTTMGTTYMNLGLYNQAGELLQQSLEAERRALGPDSPEALQLMSLCGWILARQAHYAESERMLSEAVDRETHALGAMHRLTLSTRLRLSTTLASEGRFAEAEKTQREVLEFARHTNPPDQEMITHAIDNLADTLNGEGQLAEAEKFFREGVERLTSRQGEGDPLLLREMNGLANILDREGKYAEADQVQSGALQRELQVFGPEHPSTLAAMTNLATIQMDEGHYAEAEKTLRQTVDKQDKVLGAAHPSTQHSRQMLGIALAYEKRFDESQTVFHQALQLAEKQAGNAGQASAWYDFACAAAAAGHADEALEYLGKAIDLGSGGADSIAGDSDLKPLRKDPRFVALVARVRQKEAASQKR